MSYLSGHTKLGQLPLRRARDLATQTRFKQDAAIDWSDRRAVVCLCMAQGWNAGDLAGRLGVLDNTRVRHDSRRGPGKATPQPAHGLPI
ncbi:MAG: hypothetical protein K2R98_31755 [Gemmataceae bacterium]|nr:hypothetical protein [Gemmataceae bacterium]